MAGGWWMMDDACWMMDGGLHGHLHHDDQDGDKRDLADGWWIVQMMVRPSLANSCKTIIIITIVKIIIITIVKVIIIAIIVTIIILARRQNPDDREKMAMLP